jgi:hypothetical protein
MLGNYRVASQLVTSRVVLSSIELAPGLRMSVLQKLRLGFLPVVMLIKFPSQAKQWPYVSLSGPC